MKWSRLPNYIQLVFSVIWGNLICNPKLYPQTIYCHYHCLKQAGLFYEDFIGRNCTSKSTNHKTDHIEISKSKNIKVGKERIFKAMIINFCVKDPQSL